MIENDRYHIEIHGFFILQIYAFCWWRIDLWNMIRNSAEPEVATITWPMNLNLKGDFLHAKWYSNMAKSVGNP